MANGVGVKSRLQALQIAYVLASLPTAAVAAFVAAVSKGFFALGASRQSHAIFFHPCDGRVPSGCLGAAWCADGAFLPPDRYREQIDKVNRLKEDTVRAVIKNSSDIVAFKDEVSKQLQYLKDFAEAN